MEKTEENRDIYNSDKVAEAFCCIRRCIEISKFEVRFWYCCHEKFLFDFHLFFRRNSVAFLYCLDDFRNESWWVGGGSVFIEIYIREYTFKEYKVPDIITKNQ
ncbi:hypothetical protein [uncultured Draconibacterium sp.]|uniref:hypothetical protein n=1 Tax=uncultured Draconibacterium sp. TaxID=1573823 RepID=UPI002AA61384|nr:hypothetical protein [uncultured Draconibacterium sp.]